MGRATNNGLVAVWFATDETFTFVTSTTLPFMQSPNPLKTMTNDQKIKTKTLKLLTSWAHDTMHVHILITQSDTDAVIPHERIPLFA